jgi:ABC-type Na+ efflux pump permease subunit
MSGVGIIIWRELMDLRRSPSLVWSMASLPATLVAVPLLVVWYLVNNASDAAVYFIQELYGTGGEARAEVVVAAAAHNWLPLFLVMPVFLPIIIAAASVGGERERRTLEPLLATPISTLAIVVGKSVAAVIPAVIITWLSAVVFIGGLDVIAWRTSGVAPLPNTAWSFGVLVLAPLLSLFGNTLAVVVSSRVNDARAAQNIAAMSVVPLIGVVVAQLFGRVDLGMTFYVLLAAGVAVTDLALVFLAAALFDRERLLTSWR